MTDTLAEEERGWRRWGDGEGKTYAHELLHLALLQALLQLAGFGLGESGFLLVTLLGFGFGVLICRTYPSIVMFGMV
jgi:hypothetical protein